MRITTAPALSLLLIACAGARPFAENLVLADRAVDCSCAYSMLTLTARETGDAARIRDAERLASTVGYLIAAAEALSTKEHAERRRSATLGAYIDGKASVSRSLPGDARRRRFLDALAVDLADCIQLQKQNRRELDDAARATLAHDGSDRP